VDYAALGHIHGRQQLASHVRYAGAPLHYSFGEGDKPRGSWLVDLDATGLREVAWLPLPVPRRVVTLTATLDELLGDERFAEHEDDWVCAEYTDDLPQRDPLRRLQERFRFCAKVVHAPATVSERDGRTYAQRVRAARTDRELVEAFLVHVREGAGATTAEQELIDDVLAERVRVEATA
jgi:exonuclease SbcD